MLKAPTAARVLTTTGVLLRGCPSILTEERPSGEFNLAVTMAVPQDIPPARKMRIPNCRRTRTDFPIDPACWLTVFKSTQASDPAAVSVVPAAGTSTNSMESAALVGAAARRRAA
jgi:hypothetical protein